MKAFVHRFLVSEDGQDVMEYGLLAAFISIIAILTVKTIGALVLTMYNLIGGALT